MRATTTKTTKANQTTPHSQQPSDVDQEKMEKILQDPELSRILQSPRIQQLLGHLRTAPGRAQR
jgi:hypothetical protein